MRDPAATAERRMPAATRLPARHDRALATAGLMIATALQAADATIVNIALPQLDHDFGVGIEFGAWVLTSYLCATAVVAPLTGWLRRRCGASGLFAGGVGGFVAASLLCAVAPSAALIILFRILQGAAGGVIQPLSQAMLLDLYPTERHGRMLAVWGAGIMAGPILGPLIGGIITDLASWRWIFAVNLPLGVLAVWLARRHRTETETDRQAPLDLIGVVLLMIGVGALQLCLERGVGRSWLGSPELLSEAAMAVAAAALLGWRASAGGFSVFRPDVFRDINFAVAAFFNFMLSALLFVAVVFLPLMAEGPLGYPATVAGSLIVPRAVLMTGIILGVGRLIGNIEYRILLATGWILMAAGLAILSTVQGEQSVASIIVGSTIQSIGAGMLYTPHSTLAFVTLPNDRRTDAAGLFSLLRQLGYASGVALMTAVLRLRLAAHLPATATQEAAVLAELSAYRDCFRVMAAACLAVLPGIFLFRPPPRPGRQLLAGR
ncbi:MAG TPA: MDR family MFS transporter [Stellaceae bacterium]|nr:MDR family MFS transporter [Stellaceae bacterium]